MNCPTCPNPRDARPPSRVSPWAPLALVAAVLAVASFFASATPDRRDVSEGRMPIAKQGRAL